MAEHHQNETEIWLQIKKARSKETGIFLDQAVIEALCFGWVDSKMRSLDADRFILRFTPRKPDSVWSLINRQRVESWVAEGRMTPAGLDTIKAAQASGMWQSAYSSAAPPTIPDDLSTALHADVKPGIQVSIVQKQDQLTGKRTEGTVEKLLTSSPTHPHGIKVRLVGGIGGRVKEILAVCMIAVALLLVSCGAPAATSTSTKPATTAPTTTAAFDSRLIGSWTTEPLRVKVSLNEKGEPSGTVPIGEWYTFDSTGRFYRIARYITVAIGGVMVEEGQYTADKNSIRLKTRTESFYPDPGSPQKAKYRESLAETVNLTYRIVTENAVDILYLKIDSSQTEIAFKRCT